MYAAHGHDDISIRMIQICDRTLLKSLIICFKVQSNTRITQMYGKGLTLCLYIK